VQSALGLIARNAPASLLKPPRRIRWCWRLARFKISREILFRDCEYPGVGGTSDSVDASEGRWRAWRVVLVSVCNSEHAGKQMVSTGVLN